MAVSLPRIGTEAIRGGEQDEPVPLVLGVDSSAQSTKVELRDADDGRLFGSGRAWHPRVVGPRAEQDPNVWWQALVEARHDAGGALGVGAVSVAGQRGLVVLDDAGKVLRPAKCWNDTEAAPDAAALIEMLGGPDEWVHECGASPTAASSMAQLARLRRVEPEIFARIARLLQPQDWLTLRLSRHTVTDRGGASLTGYWSPREERWRADLLALFDETRDWAGCLPTVLGPADAAGDREGVLIASGTGAVMATALGLSIRPRDVVLSVDGPSHVFTLRERPTEDHTAVVASCADATGRYLPVVDPGPLGDALGAVTKILGVDAGGFDQLAQSAPPGADGMVFVPDGDGRGALVGISPDATPALVARAAVEGVACRLLDALDGLRLADVPTGGRVLLVGGGARGPVFQQTLANLFERPVTVPKGDRTATGACVRAASVLHGVAPERIAEAWKLDSGRDVEPDPRVDAQEIRSRYREATRGRGATDR